MIEIHFLFNAGSPWEAWEDPVKVTSLTKFIHEVRQGMRDFADRIQINYDGVPIAVWEYVPDNEAENDLINRTGKFRFRRFTSHSQVAA